MSDYRRSLNGFEGEVPIEGLRHASMHVRILPLLISVVITHHSCLGDSGHHELDGDVVGPGRAALPALDEAGAL